MKKLFTLLILFASLNSFSQTGRIQQSTTLIIWYKVLPNHHYDIFVQNAHRDTSTIQFRYNDTTHSVRLGNWEKYQFIKYAPDGFTLYARNLTHPGEREWMECGSIKQVDKVKEELIKSPIIITPCWKFVIPNTIKK